MEDVVEIKYSKAFSYFALIVIVGLLALFTFVLLTNDLTKWKKDGLFFIVLTDVACFIFTIYCIVKLLIPATKRQAAIVLTKDLIIDNIRNNKIDWVNVKAIRTTSNYGSNFIAIDLNDSRKVTGQTNNILKKLLYANNKFFYGTPILIATQFLDGNKEELINTFTFFFERQRLLAASVQCMIA